MQKLQLEATCKLFELTNFLSERILQFSCIFFWKILFWKFKASMGLEMCRSCNVLQNTDSFVTSPKKVLIVTSLKRRNKRLLYECRRCLLTLTMKELIIESFLTRVTVISTFALSLNSSNFLYVENE